MVDIDEIRRKQRLLGDSRKVTYAAFPPETKSNQPQKQEGIKVKKGMTSSNDGPLIGITIPVGKKRRRPGEPNDEDKKDIYRFFGASDGMSLVEERTWYKDETGSWH